MIVSTDYNANFSGSLFGYYLKARRTLHLHYRVDEVLASFLLEGREDLFFIELLEVAPE